MAVPSGAATGLTEPAVLALTAAQRTEQERRSVIIAAVVARYFLTVFQRGDTATLDRWLAQVVPAILRGRLLSAQLASTYGQAVRRLELPTTDDGFTFQPFGDVEEAKLRASLSIVGPQQYEKALKQIEARDIAPERKQALAKKALADTNTRIQGATIRHVADGGRTTIAENTKLDPMTQKVEVSSKGTVVGYVRATRDNPCYFCAMLASRSAPSMQRGGRFSADSFTYSDSLFTGDGDAKVHDHCNCSLKPIYRKDDPLLAQAETFAEIWHASGARKSGAAAILEFRRAYEGRSAS